jgi:integrase
VERLSDSDRKKIKLYLNVDMVASPNAGYLVQGGKGSDQDQAGPPGSATIARVLAPGAGVSSARRLRDDQVARSERLGHPVITMQVYAHVMPTMKAEAAARFASLIRGQQS